MHLQEALIFYAVALLALIGYIKVRFGHKFQGVLWLLSVALLVIVAVVVTQSLRSRPLFLAVQSDDIQQVSKLLDDHPKSISSETIMGDSLLHVAVESGKAEMVELIIDKGVDVNVQGDSRATPLHLAAMSGNLEIAALLINRNANVNAIGFRDDSTPLHVAAIHGHAAVVQLLLEKGAVKDALNEHKRTALQVAIENKHLNVVQVLQR
jgi:ankyrin repeat protein